MSLVVDASVAVKWFVQEELHEAALDLLDYGEPLFSLTLVLAEIGNVLWKKCRRGEISDDQAREIAAGIEPGIPALYPVEPLIERALAIALNLSHPIYDCFYLACAEEVERGRVVTVDGRLLRTAGNTEFEHRVVHLSDLVA